MHLETCTAINRGSGTDLECKDCPGSSDGEGGRATKRRRKGDKETIPEDENHEVDTSMQVPAPSLPFSHYRLSFFFEWLWCRKNTASRSLSSAPFVCFLCLGPLTHHRLLFRDPPYHLSLPALPSHMYLAQVKEHGHPRRATVRPANQRVRRRLSSQDQQLPQALHGRPHSPRVSLQADTSLEEHSQDVLGGHSRGV